MPKPNINRMIMDMFPRPDDIEGIVSRDSALSGISRAAEGCRAAFDEITEAGSKVLSEDEQYRLGEASEYLARLSMVIGSWDR